MARTKADIKKQMTVLFISNETIQLAYGLDTAKTFDEEFSPASVENILFENFAFSGWILESNFDLLKSDVAAYISAMKPGSLKWYATMALAYQHGFSLLTDSDVFDNVGKTDEEIADSKIVKYAACVEELNQSGRTILRIKVAGAGADDLEPLSSVHLDGVKEYIARVKYAGIPIRVESNAPDAIKMKWTVYYDPLILDASGNRLDGTGEDVVRKAIKEYLTKLPFNGIYAIQKHEDYVQSVSGVALCPVQMAQKKYADYDWNNIMQIAVPDAGYMRFADDGDLEIIYVQKGALV